MLRARLAIVGSIAGVLIATETSLAQIADPCWAIAIHGGSGTIDRDAPAAEQAEYTAALHLALRAGADALARGESSLAACELVVAMLEDDPHFNAGKGAAFTEVGTHELDASIMDGSTLRCGAIAAVTTVKNPIKLARLVMERTRHILLMGDGAEAFADTVGVERVANSYFDTPRRRKMLDEVLEERRKERSAAEALLATPPSKGTVGCVALDMRGNLAAATSTGGLNGKRHGRIGDSPIIGAGNYANAFCAVSCTGSGEEFIRHSLARSIAARMEFGGQSLADATHDAVYRTLRPDDGGVIAVDREGHIALTYNSEGMYRGAADCHGRFEVAIFEGAMGAVAAAADARAPRGALLAIGGGLKRDNSSAFARFGALAGSSTGAPRIVVSTAATLSQEPEAVEIVADILANVPTASIDVVGRETSTHATVALIDRASGMFFTGGDQKRITARYRPDGVDSPELAAMRRLLARGGVIAGTSAGDAMMGSTMFFTGRSAEAIGIVSTRSEPADDDDAEAPKIVMGPQIGGGMALESWALMDSHFLERNRVGRLVAALELSKIRFGIGVSENGCVEIDLATGVATCVGDVPALVVDASWITRDGLARRGCRALLLGAGKTFALASAPLSSPPPMRPGGSSIATLPITESARANFLQFYAQALKAHDAPVTLSLDGWALTGWPDTGGGIVFDVGPCEAPK